MTRIPSTTNLAFASSVFASFVVFVVSPMTHSTPGRPRQARPTQNARLLPKIPVFSNL